MIDLDVKKIFWGKSFGWIPVEQHDAELLRFVMIYVPTSLLIGDHCWKGAGGTPKKKNLQMLLFPTIVCVLCTKLSKSLCIFFTLLDQQSIFSLPGSYLFHSFIHLSSKVYLLLHILSSYHLLYYVLGINIYTYTLLFYLKVKKIRQKEKLKDLSHIFIHFYLYMKEKGISR